MDDLIILEFQTVSNSEQLPQMDMSYDGGKGYNPVSELMRAIILRVVDDYNSSGELREEAIKYMHSEEEDYIFSFNAICRHLGLDPGKTRHQIMYSKRRISTRRRAA